MRRKLVVVLSLCVLMLAVFQQATFARDVTPTRIIPIASSGFGARLAPDGKTLVTFENIILRNLKQFDPTLLPIRVIDISSGKEIAQLSGYSDYAVDVAFTSDGKQMVSTHSNGDVNVWDMATLKIIRTLQTPLMGFYLPVKMFPDNKHVLLINPSYVQRLLVFDFETGAITQTIGKHFDSFIDFQQNYTSFPATGNLQYAAFNVSPDGTQIATSTINDEVSIVTVADGQVQGVRKSSEKPGLFSVRQMTFTADGKSLVYYDFADKQMHIWDIAGQAEKSALAMGSDSFVLSPDGSTIAWATRAKDAVDTVSIGRLDSLDKATVVLTLPDTLQVAPRITWVTFTPDGKQLVVGGFFPDEDVSNQIYVLDVPA